MKNLNQDWAENSRYFEYVSAANPRMPKIAIDIFPPALHQISESKIIPLDLHEQLETDYASTGPALMANFIHINPAESIEMV